jgi:hypothetical protein
MLDAGLSLTMVAGYSGHHTSTVRHGMRRLKHDTEHHWEVAMLVNAVELGLNANE